ncbi:LuxR C-terminal-related transcriptional regulator [Paracoccus laeviglucosivorans]|uniref:PAS domain S-box-containing protein n=1 Tax=Paracoccus laeviglucosivorans TaxID=1197861 RepID=A0A521FU08_9RHOB|nr:LuxR C-terminal-related transcriptional regulator [Paracoccus laeviglucosivorans]SMO99592.1 PAS domain S-box-containing protein [Paracoccus laeviglucosivorans]
MPERRANPNSAKEYQQLGFIYAPDATMVLSRRIILQASQMVEQTFGWKPSELEGRSIRLLYPDEADYDVIGQRARSAMLTHEVYRDERFMRLRNNSVVWMEGVGRAMDRSDPEELAIWTYRQLTSGLKFTNPLTPTEKTVAHYIVNGFTSKEIALALKSSPRTIEVHRSNMMRKLGARNSSELARRLISA